MSARASRRQVLALIALAEAPTPKTTSFDTCGDGTTIGLEFDRIAEARPWLGILGAALGDPVECDRARRDGSPYRALNAYPRDRWHGWRVMVTATEDVDEIDPLDDATREQLAAIAVKPMAVVDVECKVRRPERVDDPCEGPVAFEVVVRSSDRSKEHDRTPGCFTHAMAEMARAVAAGSMAVVDVEPIAAEPVREDLGAKIATIVPDVPIVTAAIVGAALTEADYTITKVGEAR